MNFPKIVPSSVDEVLVPTQNKCTVSYRETAHICITTTITRTRTIASGTNGSSTSSSRINKSNSQYSKGVAVGKVSALLVGIGCALLDPESLAYGHGLYRT